jgi:hypothetical protein
MESRIIITDLKELLQLKPEYEKRRDDALQKLQDDYQTVDLDEEIDFDPFFAYNHYCHMCREMEWGIQTITKGGSFRMEISCTHEPKR